MYPSLNVDILELLACELVELGLKATAVSLACCCRSFEDLVLHVLWKTQDHLITLLKCLPQDIWEEGLEGFVSKTMAFNLLFALNHSISKAFPKNPDKN